MKIYRNVNQHLTESLAEIPIPLVYIYIYIAYSYRSFVLIPMSLRLKHGSNG